MLDSINKLQGIKFTLIEEQTKREAFINGRLSERQQGILFKRGLKLVDVTEFTTIRTICHDKAVQETWLELILTDKKIKSIEYTIGVLQHNKI